MTFNYRLLLSPNIAWTANFWIALCARLCFKCFRCVGPFNSHNKLNAIITFVYRGENPGSEYLKSQSQMSPK